MQESEIHTDVDIGLLLHPASLVTPENRGEPSILASGSLRKTADSTKWRLQLSDCPLPLHMLCLYPRLIDKLLLI